MKLHQPHNLAPGTLYTPIRLLARRPPVSASVSPPMAAKGRYVSDRSHLTVSKPNPLNARQEAFARSIAEGRCQREAYKRARLHTDERWHSGRQCVAVAKACSGAIAHP